MKEACKEFRLADFSFFFFSVSNFLLEILQKVFELCINICILGYLILDTPKDQIQKFKDMNRIMLNCKIFYIF